MCHHLGEENSENPFKMRIRSDPRQNGSSLLHALRLRPIGVSTYHGMAGDHRNSSLRCATAESFWDDELLPSVPRHEKGSVKQACSSRNAWQEGGRLEVQLSIPVGMEVPSQPQSTWILPPRNFPREREAQLEPTAAASPMFAELTQLHKRCPCSAPLHSTSSRMS